MAEATAPPPRSGTRQGLVPYFARNPVAANLLMALMLAGGLSAGLQLTAQVFPTIDPGVVTVRVPYPGATPTEVEEGITRRVEEAVFGIDGVDRVLSTATENLGTVTIELKDFVDDAQVRDDVEAAVERLVDFPPQDAEQAEVERGSRLSDVLTLVVSSELPEAELVRGAEALEEALLRVPSVSLVALRGARDYEIAIEVREEALRRYDLTIGQVADAVRRSSLNLSSGELRTDAGDLLLRTNTKRRRGGEFDDIVLRARPDGATLRLRDVANVRDGFADVDLINQYNGRQSVFVTVRKSETEDALDIAADIQRMLAEYQPPRGIDVAIWDDQTEVLRDRLNLLLRNGVLGFALVFLFLVVMLDLRLATWVAMGVPISFLGAFLFFGFFDVNVNMVSLFALIIVLGIVVDDAVVVGENIVAEQEAGGSGPAAAIVGALGVRAPVTIGVLTTMAAFAPLLFVTGTLGQILAVVPVVVIAVLAMSLVEVFCILPAHLAHGRPWSRWPLDVFQARVSQAVRRFRDEKLVPVVALAVRRRYLTLLGGVALLTVAGVLLATGQVRFFFFPSLESNQLRADLEFPVGTPFDVTRAAAERLVAAAHRTNEQVGGTSFRSVAVTIGGATASGPGPGGGTRLRVASNIASVQVVLNGEPQRTLAAGELERIWRGNAGDIPGAERLNYTAEFLGPGSDLEYELAHQDDAVLRQAVADLKAEYRALPSLQEIQDSVSLGKRQYDIELTPAGEAAGLTPADVARQLRGSFFGEEVQRIQRGRREVKVMVRYPDEQRRSPRDLFNARIRLADGTEAPLPTVATVTESRSFASIDRIDGLRIVTVSAQVDSELATPTEMNTLVQTEVLPKLQARYPRLQMRQAGLGREQSEDLGALSSLGMVALLVIFVLIASQLRSYAQPFIILASVPCGAAGAVIGHWLLGHDLSFISIFGMVALSGVVVNDSLVMIDRYNKFRTEEGMGADEAIVAAARHRFRAIFLTTATTALGLTPMLFETSTQAQFLIPMAVSLATGIVFASAVILFLVPALVSMRENWRVLLYAVP